MRLYEFFIAWRYMTSNIRQSLIISGAVGIGVSIIIFVPSINLSFFNDLIDKTLASAPHVRITKELVTFPRDVKVLTPRFKQELLLEDQTQTRRRNIKSYRGLVRSIASVDGVVAASPFASGQGIVVRGAEERGVSVKGIIPEKEVNVTDIENDIIRGRIQNLNVTDIVIGKVLADKINVDLNDRITVIGPRSISRSFKIVGIFSTGLRGQDEGQVYTNLRAAQQLLALGTDVTNIGVRVDDIYRADVIADRIEKITGLTADSWKEDNKQILEQITRFQIIIAFINFLIIFAAASSITSVFIMMIASKSKEIGIMKSMGAKNHSIMIIFLSQAITLSVLGYLVGILGAKGLIEWYSYILSSATETFLTTDIPDLKINWNYAFLAMVYSIITSVIASIIPAYQAAKLNPVEAINA